jgi:hypothetical protein
VRFAHFEEFFDMKLVALYQSLSTQVKLMFNKTLCAHAALSLAALLLWAPKASALFVYLDMNNNPEEHAAFRTSVSKLATNEQIVFIPQENDLNAIDLKALTNKRDHIWEQYAKKGCLAEITCHPVLTGACGDLQKSLRASEDAVAKNPKVPLNETTLRAGLQAIKLNSSEPITLVISGHFGGGVFTGNLGSFSVADLERIFSDYPEIREQITSLDLLGCYTNTFSQVQSMWRHAFPNARVLVGFYGPSPRGETDSNLHFISDIVARRDKFEAVRTKGDFSSQLNDLKKYTEIHVALAIDDYFQQTDGPLLRVSSEQTAISKCVADLPTSEISYFEKILNGDAMIPENTSESRLRAYYTALRDHATCLDDPQFRSSEPSAPSPDKVIRLILYKNVVRNFRNIHGADLVNFDNILQGLGVTPDLSIRKVNLADRKALINWKKAVELKLGTIANRAQVQSALSMLKNLSDVLVTLEPRCVPFDWVEPSGTHVSECFRVTGQCS